MLVDFTASWCAACHVNLRIAIDTEAVRKRVEANGVVPMLADWSSGSDEIGDMLADLSGGDEAKAGSIPLLAIFPADRPHQALVLRAIVSQAQVLECLGRGRPFALGHRGLGRRAAALLDPASTRR